MDRMRKALLFSFIIAGGCAKGIAGDLVNINVQGRVTATPCTVDAGSVSQTVDFGQILGTNLVTAGAASDWKSFQVKVMNCPAATVTAIATFSGIPDSSDAALYSNGSSPGDATNIAIQVAEDADKSSIKSNGTSMSINIDPVSHAAIFPLAGRVITPTGDAGPGRINSVVLMTFTYQ
ncbi:fimbrial protein [Scandinavium sp. M-37]|uniref:fimbrial protein n=1 Tax=Scandinavium sp. M-37 TaxID=3373077 RepID=UPI003745BBC0